MIKAYTYPIGYKNSELYKVRVRNCKQGLGAMEVELKVFENPVADFAQIEFDEEVEVTVTVESIGDLGGASVRPMSYGVNSEVQGREIRFKMTEPKDIKVDVPGMKDLFIYCSTVEDSSLIEGDEVIFLEQGQIYCADSMELTSGQTLYLEGGAVLRGRVHAVGDGITVAGRGIIDGGLITLETAGHRHTVQLERCTNATLRDFTIINPQRWITVLGDCDNVHIDSLRELGLNMSTDGIDICGSRNVLVENCTIKCNDDCIVIKSIDLSTALADEGHGDYDKGSKQQNSQPKYISSVSWEKNVENITVRNCRLQTHTNGAIMEIGHELVTDHVKDVVFENIDVLGAHGFGSVFSMQNADRATIENVLYKNIRVEHCYDKVINFRIMNSVYSKNGGKGNIRHVRFEDIDWCYNSWNRGYTTSTIGGYDSEHTVHDVTLKNFKINGEFTKTTNILNLFTRFTTTIETDSIKSADEEVKLID